MQVPKRMTTFLVLLLVASWIALFRYWADYNEATHLEWLILVKANNGKQIIRGIQQWDYISAVVSETPQSHAGWSRVKRKILSGFKNISWEEAREQEGIKYLWER